MAFFRRVRKRLQGDDPQQLKRELQWLQTQVGRYKGKILAVGLLSLTGTIMGLVSSVASKYLIDAVTGYGADMLWRAVAIMAVMLLGSLVLQGVSSRVGGSGNRYPIAAGTRGVFAYVPQGNSVFPGTIAENLRLVSPDATDGELEQALKIAVRRKEKLLQPGSFWWDFFEKVWIRVIPLRPGIAAAYSALTGAFRKAETAHD